MSFIDQNQVNKITEKLISNDLELKKIYRAKKGKNQTRTVDHSSVDELLSNGWDIEKELKTKTKLTKAKSHSKEFEDDIWCQFYELGCRKLNSDETFVLPFGKDSKDKKQIDVIAIYDETVFLIECKSSKKPKKAPSYKDEFDLLKLRLDGFKKSKQQALNKKIKIKYIFATRNLRLAEDSEDLKRLKESRAFYYDDDTYLYVNNLIKHYKKAARYQFLGLVLKSETINDEKIEIPAIEGDMGGKKYYMFSIEPDLLLKIGFVLHRTKANGSEFPTYQRLLQPARLKGITKFIDEGGYFPNSIIVNFSGKKKLQFEHSKTTKNSSSKLGVLKITNAYAVAYIIDGQHRLYGYANSKYKKSNTIPVVAFDDLDSIEQLKLFMDINENQKAVSPNLRLDLEEDLHWESPLAGSRLKALRSSIIKTIAYSQKSPLYNKISVGEEKSLLSFRSFADALLKSGLLPKARGNKYDEKTILPSLYDTGNLNHEEEMNKCKKNIVQLLSTCYEFVASEYKEIFEKEKYFIVSDRGTYAFITLIGSLNAFLVSKGELNKESSLKERFECLKKYLASALEGITNLTQEENDKYLSLLGASADVKWFRFFQSSVNSEFSEYETLYFIDLKEKQDDELQDQGKGYGKDIERYIKHKILDNLKKLYEDNWELEIASIQRACVDRAEQERERNYKDGLGNEEIDWTGMFNINDYKDIIKKHWSKKLKDDIEFKPFEDIFSVDIGLGFRSKDDRIKWISNFNKYRNLLAHKATKGKGLNKKEVTFLYEIYKHFKLNE
jgi:DNA sulfur modification protein DndB